MKNIVITLSEDCLERLNAVADSLSKEGLTITHLYEYGVITGCADELIIKSLRARQEIVSLTEEKQVTISPPDSEIQ